MKKRIYIQTLTLLFFFLPLYGQEKGILTTLSDVVVKEKNDTLFVEMNIHVPYGSPGSRGSLRIIPGIISSDGENSYLLPTVGADGKKREQLNRRKERFNRHTDKRDDAFTYRLSDSLFSYRLVLPYELWMDDAAFEVKEIVRGCAGSEQVYTFANLSIQVHSLVPYIARPVVEFYEPLQEVKVRTLEKTAYLDFQVGKTVIVPDFKRNPVELEKIIETIREVRNDKDITINHIEITGYASPEGSYGLNERLAEGRTKVLKNYIRDRFSLKDNLFRTNWVAEDWEGFEEMVLSSDLPQKEQVLSIIASEKTPDQKEADLKKLPVYRSILNEMFPDLRRSVYRIGYTLRDYSVEEVEVLITKQPENLSPFEFYQIAKQNEEGSDRWNEIMLSTVQYNPEDAVSNINAAAVLLQKGNPEAAYPYLQKAKDDPRVHTNMAAYYLLSGDPDRAEEHLKKASVGDKKLIEKNKQEAKALRFSQERRKRKEN